MIGLKLPNRIMVYPLCPQWLTYSQTVSSTTILFPGMLKWGKPPESKLLLNIYECYSLIFFLLSVWPHKNVLSQMLLFTLLLIWAGTECLNSINTHKTRRFVSQISATQLLCFLIASTLLVFVVVVKTTGLWIPYWPPWDINYLVKRLGRICRIR